MAYTSAQLMEKIHRAAEHMPAFYQADFVSYIGVTTDTRELCTEVAAGYLLEHPELFAAPIVRNGREATVGYCPEVWETWT